MRLCVVHLMQAAIELQDVGDVFRNLVAGAVTADGEVFRLGVVGLLHGMPLTVMLSGRVSRKMGRAESFAENCATTIFDVGIEEGGQLPSVAIFRH